MTIYSLQHGLSMFSFVILIDDRVQAFRLSGYQEAVRVAASLASEYREDEAVEEHRETETGHSLDPPEPGVGLLVPGLDQEDHPEHEEAVHPEDKVGLHDELGLRPRVNILPNYPYLTKRGGFGKRLIYKKIA